MKTRNMVLGAIFAGLFAGLSLFSVPAEGAEKAKKEVTVVVAKGKTVKLNYTLKVDGKVYESSIGQEPLQFKAGSGQVIPGFEKAVMGMKAGQKKAFSVSPAEGHGPEDPRLIKSVPKTQIPPEIKPKAGMILDTEGRDGKRVPVRVMEVRKDVVVINYNHPLAGKTLKYDVEILEVK